MEQNDSCENSGTNRSMMTEEELREPLLSHEEQLFESTQVSTNSSPNNDNENNDDCKNIRIPSWIICWCQSSFKVNHNVLLILLSSVLYGVSDSLWGGTVIAAYLNKLGHGRNSPVGDVEAASGLATVLSALPIGYLADRYGKSKVVAGGGGLMMTTAVLHAVLLGWIGNNHNNNTEKANHEHGNNHDSAFWLFGAIMALWGIGSGIVNGPAQALYADSTPAGQRSTYYLYLFVSYLLASSIGPLVSILLFQTIGNEWDLHDLRLVIYVGLAISMGNSAIMMLLDDDKALVEERVENGQSDDGEESSANIHNKNSHIMDTATDAEVLHEETLIEMSGTDTARTIEPPPQQTSTSNDDILINSRQRYIPYIIFSSSCMLTLGAGMTVKFFPLFFKDDIGLSPTQVQIIYVFVPLTMAVLSGVCKFLASICGFGRVQTSVLFKSAGVTALFTMVFCKKYLDKHPFLLVPLFILRTGLMNAPYPLEESILMDYVPKNERARWKSLDSIAMFGWCGSAAIGGWLTDKYDYTYTFLITAVLQTVGTLVFALLLPLVPRKEEELTTQRHELQQETMIVDNNAFQAVSTASLSTEGSDGDNSNSCN